MSQQTNVETPWQKQLREGLATLPDSGAIRDPKVFIQSIGNDLDRSLLMTPSGFVPTHPECITRVGAFTQELLVGKRMEIQHLRDALIAIEEHTHALEGPRGTYEDLYDMVVWEAVAHYARLVGVGTQLDITGTRLTINDALSTAAAISILHVARSYPEEWGWNNVKSHVTAAHSEGLRVKFLSYLVADTLEIIRTALVKSAAAAAVNTGEGMASAASV